MTRATGRVRRGEPLARHTSWRVGGPVDCYFEPVDIADLRAFLVDLPAGEPDPIWIGMGSNLLVRDGGIRGSVICPNRGLRSIAALDSTRLRVEAGVTCARIARRTLTEGMAGGEFFSGIPGTLGGALAMNAGAFGGETWNVVQSVETLDRGGDLRQRSAEEYRVGYRRVTAPAQEWFVAAVLCFETGDPAAIRARIRDVLTRRRASQPLDLPSAGSVFRNPPGDHAARLIELCGLKGRRIGGAQVSARHANFILNEGKASASDIEALIELVRRTVREGTGVDLEPEIRTLGEPG